MVLSRKKNGLRFQNINIIKLFIWIHNLEQQVILFLECLILLTFSAWVPFIRELILFSLFIAGKFKNLINFYRILKNFMPYYNTPPNHSHISFDLQCFFWSYFKAILLQIVFVSQITKFYLKLLHICLPLLFTISIDRTAFYKVLP